MPFFSWWKCFEMYDLKRKSEILLLTDFAESALTAEKAAVVLQLLDSVREIWDGTVNLWGSLC